MRGWRQNGVTQNKTLKLQCSPLTCKVLDAVPEPALCLTTPKCKWPKIFTLCWAPPRETEGEKEGLPASIRQPGWGSTAGCQPLCSVRRCLFHSLIPRGRERQNLSHGCVFLFTQLFQTFPHLWRKDNKNDGSPTCGTEAAGPCRVYIRLMVFIMSDHADLHLQLLQVHALCSQDSGFQVDLTWDHMCVCRL